MASQPFNHHAAARGHKINAGDLVVVELLRDCSLSVIQGPPYRASTALGPDVGHPQSFLPGERVRLLRQEANGLVAQGSARYPEKIAT